MVGSRGGMDTVQASRPRLSGHHLEPTFSETLFMRAKKMTAPAATSPRLHSPRPALRVLGALAASVALAVGGTGAALAKDITLKASHQFPGGKGDVRDEMVQMIAKDVAAANVGLTIKVFPGIEAW